MALRMCNFGNVLSFTGNPTRGGGGLAFSVYLVIFFEIAGVVSGDVPLLRCFSASRYFHAINADFI